MAMAWMGNRQLSLYLLPLSRQRLYDFALIGLLRWQVPLALILAAIPPVLAIAFSDLDRARMPPLFLVCSLIPLTAVTWMLGLMHQAPQGSWSRIAIGATIGVIFLIMQSLALCGAQFWARGDMILWGQCAALLLLALTGWGWGRRRWRLTEPQRTIMERKPPEASLADNTTALPVHVRILVRGFLNQRGYLGWWGFVAYGVCMGGCGVLIGLARDDLGPMLFGISMMCMSQIHLVLVLMIVWLSGVLVIPRRVIGRTILWSLVLLTTIPVGIGAYCARAVAPDVGDSAQTPLRIAVLAAVAGACVVQILALAAWPGRFNHLWPASRSGGSDMPGRNSMSVSRN
jgi:hypothetical protein